MKAITPELQSLQSVAAAVLDSNGILLEANAGFMRLLGIRSGRRIGADAAGCFQMPGFRELVAAKVSGSGEIYFGTMRFDDGNGGSVELRGRAWRSAFGLCVLAETAVGAPAGEARTGETPARSRAHDPVQIVDAASTDKLTGTGNRERLEEAFAIESTRVRRTGLPLAVFLAGIDRFAALTEKYGQGGTDKVLARCGFLLRLLTRPTDIVTRCGAEEFAILLPHTNLAQAVSAAERIRKVLEKEVVEPLGEPATVSFGVAEFQAGEDLAAFLGRAGGALRQARDAGHNRVAASG